MLCLTIPVGEFWNEENSEFVYSKETELRLEHSLISLSKWESEWCKPFLSTDEFTRDEILSYIRCMTLNQHVDPHVYLGLTQDNLVSITDYIKRPMTATTFSGQEKPGRGVITSEIIYYWMIVNGVPMECEKWHLNRLLTLIRVCAVKSAPAKKMGRRDILSRNAALNAQRRKRYGTKG